MPTDYVRTPAEQEFAEWLDSIATPVDTSRPLVEPGRDYAQEKHDKREAHRHRYLMKHNFWYKQSHLYHQEQEQLQLEAEMRGETYIETEPKEYGATDFWEQFQ